MREKDLVVLTRDVLDRGLRAGDIGTIVLVYREGAGYEVEFSTLAGRTLAVVTMRAEARIAAAIGRRTAHH